MTCQEKDSLHGDMITVYLVTQIGIVVNHPIPGMKTVYSCILMVTFFLLGMISDVHTNLAIYAKSNGNYVINGFSNI